MKKQEIEQAKKYGMLVELKKLRSACVQRAIINLDNSFNNDFDKNIPEVEREIAEAKQINEEMKRIKTE